MTGKTLEQQPEYRDASRGGFSCVVQIFTQLTEALQIKVIPQLRGKITGFY